MQKLTIKGKRELTGKISISGSKNATLPILAASILASQVKLKNVPLVKDIFTMVELLNFIGLETKIGMLAIWPKNSSVIGQIGCELSKSQKLKIALQLFFWSNSVFSIYYRTLI